MRNTVIDIMNLQISGKKICIKNLAIQNEVEKILEKYQIEIELCPSLRDEHMKHLEIYISFNHVIISETFLSLFLNEYVVKNGDNLYFELYGFNDLSDISTIAIVHKNEMISESEIRNLLESFIPNLQKGQNFKSDMENKPDLLTYLICDRIISEFKKEYPQYTAILNIANFQNSSPRIYVPETQTQDESRLNIPRSRDQMER